MVADGEQQIEHVSSEVVKYRKVGSSELGTLSGY
jgi:hypothetical protein